MTKPVLTSRHPLVTRTKAPFMGQIGGSEREGDQGMTNSEGLPDWARRIREERDARGWSHRQFAAALRAHSKAELPGEDSLIRRVKAWQAGDGLPDDFYRPLIGRTFGMPTAAIFGVQGARRDADAELVSGTGMNTLEILTRLRTSSVDKATLDGLAITVDRLCSEYPHMPPDSLLLEGRQWLRRITTLLDRRLTVDQHREILALAGWLALLVGCVEYDMSDRAGAEATRREALSLAQESGAAEIAGWAHEMRAWFALTRGDYRGVIAASEQGQAIAPNTSAAVQLAGQKAKAWARIGDRRQVEVALDQGRSLLEELPHPENLDHHFVVDPAKWTFYSMDAYRLMSGATEQRLAETYAREVLRSGVDAGGVERSPMRNAEARATLGVVAAREGDLEQALTHGRRALQGERQSLPSLLMVSQELAAIMTDRFSREPDAAEYLAQLRELRDGVRT
jgi:tetratricopeptide (TPR) repeat protein